MGLLGPLFSCLSVGTQLTLLAPACLLRSYICVSSSPYYGDFPGTRAACQQAGRRETTPSARLFAHPGLLQGSCAARTTVGLRLHPAAGFIKKAFPDCSVKPPIMTAPKWLVYLVS